MKWINEFNGTFRDTGRKVKRRFGLDSAIFEFTNHPTAPMTYQLSPTCFIRPDNHFYSDLGTVRWFLRPIVPHDLHTPSFVLHDSACTFHGLWFSTSYEGPYLFSLVRSERAHWLLGQALGDAGYPIRGPIARIAVGAFGPKWGWLDASRGDKLLRPAPPCMDN